MGGNKTVKGCNLVQRSEVQLAFVVDVGGVATEISVKTSVFLALLFLDIGVLKFNGNGTMLMVVSGYGEQLVHLHGRAAVLLSLELHVGPGVLMHVSVTASVVLLGIEDLLIIWMAMEEAAGIVEVFRKELHVLDASDVDGLDDLGDAVRSWPRLFRTCQPANRVGDGPYMRLCGEHDHVVS